MEKIFDYLYTAPALSGITKKNTTMTTTISSIALAMTGILATGESAWLPVAVGTYTSGESKGIYSLSFNQDNGESRIIAASKAANPSFLAENDNGSVLYAVDESGTDTDAIHAFSFGEKGEFIHLGSISTEGKAPCHVSTKRQIAVTANYSGGSLTAFSLKADGSLDRRLSTFEFPLTGPAPDSIRQQSAHVHCAVFHPDGRHLMATDLGNDCIYTFAFRPDSNQPLTLKTTTPVTPGAGPRHLTFSHDGRFAYLVTELSGEVMVFACEDGQLKWLQTELCDEFHARASADIRLSPDGRFLYASCRRTNDGITIFSVDEPSGKISRIGRQPTAVHPRNFAISPNGKFLLCACRDSDKIQVFAIDPDTGLLTDTHQDISIPAPVCVLFTRR